MEAMLEVMLEHMSEQGHDQIRASATSGMMVASMCAGYDMPSVLLSRAANVFRSKLGIELNMPVIAAECCPRKREYLLKRGLEYRHVFADMAELLEPTAYDYVCGKKVAVPRPDMVLGGFSCKDVSRIKRSRPSFDSDASTSGLTFRLLLQLVGLWRPKWVLLENEEEGSEPFPQLYESLEKLRAAVRGEGSLADYPDLDEGHRRLSSGRHCYAKPRGARWEPAGACVGSGPPTLAFCSLEDRGLAGGGADSFQVASGLYVMGWLSSFLSVEKNRSRLRKLHLGAQDLSRRFPEAIGGFLTSLKQTRLEELCKE
eukprot:s4946_g1.t1